MSPSGLRLVLAATAGTLSVAVAALAVRVTAASDPSWLDWVLCGLFVPAMAWEALVLCQVGLGFALWLRGGASLSDVERQAARLAPVSTGRSRTALLMPIFDEDVQGVFDGVAVMRRSLARLGPCHDIDLHVLSDTRDPATAAAEVEAVAEARRVRAGPPVHYRRRIENAGRKAGNLAEFLERTRGDYDFAIVLDADSLMSGEAVRILIRLMEDDPGTGLIQTISYAANRTTLFARIQQFAVRLYAPLSLRAAAAWQGREGLYYGHNAILRCAAFADHARLPVLPGKPPIGGEILCHDVVEAALLVRAGWAVRSLPDSEGTWEEMPTNVVDLLGRERRWCQGNLQHARVLPIPGLALGSRLHILLGIGGYAAAPLWWLLLCLGALRVAFDPDGSLGILAYGVTEAGRGAALLLALSAAILLGPRILNVVRALGTPREHAGFGGTGRLAASVALEQLFSVLLTPPLSLINAGFVLQTLAGKVVPWSAQSRADRVVGWPEALSVSLPGLALAAALAASAALAGGWYAAWMAPTIAGLVLAPAVIAWSSRRTVGEAAARLGLFLTVDETDPAEELLDLRRLRAGDRDPVRAVPRSLGSAAEAAGG